LFIISRRRATATYRVIYDVNRSRIIVVILKVGHRKEVYR
jgi:mRNA-degrading endonuclease RelE of RelBE toxin-antitoxin system